MFGQILPFNVFKHFSGPVYYILYDESTIPCQLPVSVSLLLVSSLFDFLLTCLLLNFSSFTAFLCADSPVSAWIVYF